MTITESQARAAAEREYPYDLIPAKLGGPADGFGRTAYAKALLKLAPYINHKPDCNYWKPFSGGPDFEPHCDCGLSTILNL